MNCRLEIAVSAGLTYYWTDKLCKLQFYLHNIISTFFITNFIFQVFSLQSLWGIPLLSFYEINRTASKSCSIVKKSGYYSEDFKLKKNLPSLICLT